MTDLTYWEQADERKTAEEPRCGCGRVLRYIGGDLAATCTGCRNLPDACPCGPSPVARVQPPVDGDGQEETAPRTWRPRDLADVLEGRWKAPEPTVGRRDDGAGLFYPGRKHAIAAESEAGKTWVALAAVIAEMAAGNGAVYLDFEDDAGGIVGRMLAMGCPRGLIRDRFAYIGPEAAIDFTGRCDLDQAIGDLRPTLAVIDGITEAMSLHGLEMRDNTDVAKFGRILPQYIAAKGPAVVQLDHVTKDRETRGGHAIGGIHKLNGINGASYVMENRKPFGIGLTGRSRLLIKKDRPGQLRRNGKPVGEGLFWYADLTVESHDETFAEVALEPPADDGGRPFRPTAIMAKVCEALTGLQAGLSKNAIEGAVGGKRETVRLALELLVNEGYVKAEKQGQAVMHTLVKAWADE